MLPTERKKLVNFVEFLYNLCQSSYLDPDDFSKVGYLGQATIY